VTEAALPAKTTTPLQACGRIAGLSELRKGVKRQMRSGSALEVIVYDLMGRRLDINRDQLYSDHGGAPRIVVLTYWDSAGNFVRSEKVFIY
jgi:hypothetical protein